MDKARIVIVMGVAGAGKTTVGRALADFLGWDFVDGDDVHPPSNIAKMTAGQPLTDADRHPWLDRLCDWIDDHLAAGRNGVLACSALKESYRRQLKGGRPEVELVYLKTDPAVLARRLEQRQGHYAKANLLASQLATLEEPQDGFTVDASAPPERIVETIRRRLGASPS